MEGTLAVGLGYDPANRRISLSYPNGTSTSYTYDVASRLTNILHQGPTGILENLAYVYDAAGNRTSLTRNNAAASLLPAAVASASYDAANEQTAFAGATLTYDANGNLTHDGVNTYQWDARNRLIGMSGGTTASFRYDALGRRVSKTLSTQSSALSTGFLYDGNDIAAEIGGGAVGANYVRSLAIDEPFIRQAGTGNEFYHTDALGSSVALSNGQGAPATTYGYEPFGKTAVVGTSANPFQFTSRENDGTGAYYYRNRYYKPGTARFINEDPSRFFNGDLNFYMYVRNAPTVLVDPSGLVGVGTVGSATVTGGAGVIGGAGSYAIGSGVFFGGQQGVSLGSFQSVGGFIGGPDYGPSYPNDNSGNSAAGGYVGGGVGGFITNADSPNDLTKTTTTISGDIGLGVVNASVQLSFGNGIYILSVVPPSPLSRGIGYAVTTMQTNTTVVSCINLSRRKC